MKKRAPKKYATEEQVTEFMQNSANKSVAKWFRRVASRLEDAVDDLKRNVDYAANAKDPEDVVHAMEFMVNTLQQLSFRQDEAVSIAAKYTAAFRIREEVF